MLEVFQRKSLRKLNNKYTFKNLSAVTLQTLSKNDMYKVLEWRNNYFVRSMMNDSKKISKKDHILFIDFLKNEKNMFYYKVDDIGVIYLTKLNEELPFLGLYVNLDNPTNRKGTILLEFILYLAFEKLKLKDLGLEVKMTNVKAIKLYYRAGFEKVEEKDGNLIMKLNNEFIGE